MSYKIKTVWHWGNIMKVFAVVIAGVVLSSLVVNAMGIENLLVATLIGSAIGWGSASIGLRIWDCWHFE